MAVNLVAWDETLESVRRQLRLAEQRQLDLANQIAAHNKVVNAYRDELQHLERLDADLTSLMAARGEVRS